MKFSYTHFDGTKSTITTAKLGDLYVASNEGVHVARFGTEKELAAWIDGAILMARWTRTLDKRLTA